MKNKMATYKNLIKLPIIDNKEKFVVVNFYDENIEYGHNYTKTANDMIKYFDGKIIVRKSVAKKLAKANWKLREKNFNYTLYVTYGYRLLEIQTERFQKEFSRCDNELSVEEKKEFTHKKIAVPEVAGHPTGGAIDITIFDKKRNEFLDMGCMISDFSKSADKKRATFSKEITEIQEQNRLLLHDTLITQGFCPYYEEWWHFSYGDKEWAWFYGKNNAIYKQKKLNDIKLPC